jgi:hypothetical protein
MIQRVPMWGVSARPKLREGAREREGEREGGREGERGSGEGRTSKISVWLQGNCMPVEGCTVTNGVAVQLGWHHIAEFDFHDRIHDRLAKPTSSSLI